MELMKSNTSTDTATVTFNIGELDIPGKLTLKNVNVTAEGETCITDAVAAMQTGVTKAVLESTWFGHLFMVVATKAERFLEILLKGIEFTLEQEKFKFECEKQKIINQAKENKEETEEEKPATEE